MTDKEKELCAQMPYLQPHTSTGELLNFDWCEASSLPEGWYNLFIQMCEDIKPLLEKAGTLNTFYFTKVAEEKGKMVVTPSKTTKAIKTIIQNYEHLSQFICERCGKPADIQTQSRIMEFCQECADKSNNFGPKVELNLIRTAEKTTKGVTSTVEYDCTDIWNRLYPTELEN